MKQIEDRLNQKIRSNKQLIPYILFPHRVDLGDYKAVSLLKRKFKPKTVSRISFGNPNSEIETNISQFTEFPLSVEKPKKNEDWKLNIKDVANDLVEHAHASFISKK